MSTNTHLWEVIQAWLDVLPYPPSQARLGKRLGLSRSAVSDWKQGKSRPTPEHLRRLAVEMEPVAGPDIYQRLVDAVVRDLGYIPDGEGQSRIS
jgi:transcriptional regulator with XRE-family HTH domain